MNNIYFVGFNFIIYSFLGWIIEELYCLFTKKTLKKEGFLKGPIKPMYGITMTTLVLCLQLFKINKIYMIILCFFIPSIVEYISGYLLDHVFNKSYWSYSQLKFNIKGYVSLKFSLYWMLLSFIGVYYLQPVLNNIYMYINGVEFRTIIIILEFLILGDIAYTIRLFKFKKNNRVRE